MATKKSSKPIRCAVIGYGGAFNMGKAHAEWMNAAGLQTVAVCDLDPTRTESAKTDLPGVETYTDVAVMLKTADIDLCTIVTPHNTHAPLALQCLEAGKHVVSEKPFCITVKEATAMIEAAKAAKVTLTTFHNRRHDGDFKAIKDVIDRGLIGDVFHIEMYMGGYGHPGTWWRANKKISGGAFYDWGAHVVDWTLNLVPGPIESVTGYFHKLVWMDQTNEDQVRGIIKFKNGCVADIQQSTIARVGKARWRILGTKGAIEDNGGGQFRLVTELEGLPVDTQVKYFDSDWNSFYVNLAKHLYEGAPLEVTPESARRVIGVIETAEKSSKSGKAEKVPYE